MKFQKTYALIVAQVFLSCINLNGKIDTLKELTDAVFTKCPEYCDSTNKNALEIKGKYKKDTIFKEDNVNNPKELLAQIEAVAKINKEFYKNKQNWIDNSCGIDEKYLNLEEEMAFDSAGLPTFLQKIQINKEDEIFFMGDIHGSVHTLLRSLVVLFLDGYIDNEFKIKKDKFYMIFLGDYGDRGWYSFETWFTLLKLKEKNPEHVFLIRGNHETIRLDASVSNVYGFLNVELKKFDTSVREKIKNYFLNFFEHLPAAIYLKYNDDFIRCNHGSPICEKNDDQEKDFLSSDEHSLKSVKNNFIDGYLYEKGNHGEPKNFIDIIKPNDLRFVFRGHNHHFFGLKLFPLDPAHYDKIIDSAKKDEYKGNECNKDVYKDVKFDDNGLYWRDAFKVSLEIKENSFNIGRGDIARIFTLSASTGDAIMVSYDCFCILKIGEDISNSVLTVHEKDLKKDRGETIEVSGPAKKKVNKNSGKYVSISKLEDPQVLQDKLWPIKYEYTEKPMDNPTGNIFSVKLGFDLK